MGYASDMAAQLTRQVWEDYKSTYQPIAISMLDNLTYNNPSIVTNALDQSRTNVNASYDAQATNKLTALSRYGVAPTAAQTQTSDRLSSLSRSTAIVDAANNIRMKLADRDQALLLGGLPNTGKSYGLRTEVGE